MSLNLPLEPKSKRNPTFTIIAAVLLIAIIGYIWWQRDETGLTDVAGIFPQGVVERNQVVADVDATSDQVQLVRSVVVTPPADNEASLSEFFLAQAEHDSITDWTGINGRTAIEIYIVQSGDTLWGIAAKFGLDVDTLRWSNPDLERNPDLLSVNTQMTILPVIGAYYTVVAGDTLAKIATRYGVAEADIINYPLNQLDTTALIKPGDKLVVPNGRKDVQLPAPKLDNQYPLAWPIQGRLTQGYHAQHLGIDLGAPYSSDVYAADAGTVIYAEWAKTGYGYTVIIDHGNGRQTLYSHLKGALVKSGEAVARGQVIGQVGSTGNSTGPHVHFEVRENDNQVNPLDYLRR